MAVRLKTRKPVTELTPADLEAYPVWEYTLDEEDVPGQDETWVRPLDRKVVPAEGYSMPVATEFRTACGRSYPGFSIVSTGQGDIEIDGGVILAEGSYLLTEDREGLLACSGLTKAELYPITFELRVPIQGESEHRGGSLPGAV